MFVWSGQVWGEPECPSAGRKVVETPSLAVSVTTPKPDLLYIPTCFVAQTLPAVVQPEEGGLVAAVELELEVMC